MKFGVLTVIVLCLSVVKTAPSILYTDMETNHLDFVNDLILNLNREQSIRTLIHLIRGQNRNCLFSNMRTTEIPLIQLTEMSYVDVKEYFNSEVLALLCINEYADTMLLTTLANCLRRLPWGRIIIWINIRDPKDLPQVLFIIGNQATEHKFMNLLAIHQKNETVNTYHLKPFPDVHFEKVDNLLNTRETIFYHRDVNFHGKSATLLTNDDGVKIFKTRMGKSKSLYFSDFREKLIREFAIQTNLSLRVRNAKAFDAVTEPFDFLNDNYLFKMTNVDFSKTIFHAVLMIVVPCGDEAFSILDIYRSSQAKNCVIYILIIYIIFSVLESVVSMCSFRIAGRRHNLTFINLFVNLRAFSTILGQSYPTSRRATTSLRQIVVVMHIAGLIITTFFGSNLTSMLTKRLEFGHIRNFKELRESKLTVLVDPLSQLVIEHAIGPEFFKNVLPNYQVIDNDSKYELLNSLNNSYAYVVLGKSWDLVRDYHKLFGRKYFCESPDLMLVRETEVRTVLERNSIYKRDLNLFLTWLESTGLPKHWSQDARRKVISLVNSQTKDKLRQSSLEAPLTLAYLQLAWNVLVFGYGIAFFIFLIEMFMAYWQRRRQIRPFIV